MTCEHVWSSEENPRSQYCERCQTPRWRVQSLNHGYVGRKYWNALWAKRTDHPGYPKTYQTILNFIVEGDRVIDVGCGIGNFCAAYRGKFPVEQFNKHTIYGLDISEVAITHTANRVLEFYGYPCDFPAEVPIQVMRKNDVVVATEFLEHIQDAEAAVIGLSKLLKDEKSTLYVSVPDYVLGPEQEAEHHHKFNASTLDELLSKWFDEVSIVVLAEEEKLLAICTKRVETTSIQW